MNGKDHARMRRVIDSNCALRRENKALRAKLAEVEAERNEWRDRASLNQAEMVAVKYERDALASKAARIFERSAEPDPLLDEVDRLREENEHWRTTANMATKNVGDWIEQTNLSSLAHLRALKAEAKLARVARVRDWMGENNDDAEYDLVIVALNNILEGGDRGN